MGTAIRPMEPWIFIVSFGSMNAYLERSRVSCLFLICRILDFSIFSADISNLFSVAPFFFFSPLLRHVAQKGSNSFGRSKTADKSSTEGGKAIISGTQTNQERRERRTERKKQRRTNVRKPQNSRSL